jgi:hypothetical protein
MQLIEYLKKTSGTLSRQQLIELLELCTRLRLKRPITFYEFLIVRTGFYTEARSSKLRVLELLAYAYEQHLIDFSIY